MSLLSGLKSLVNTVAGGVQAILGQFADIIKVVLHIRDYTIGCIETATNLFETATKLWDELIHFKFVIAWKTRVISVSRVFENIQELIAIPGKIFDAIKDLISSIKGRFTTLEATAAVEEVIPGIGQAAGIITAVCEILVLIKGCLTDLQTVVDAIKKVVEDVTNLNAIFLPNRNTRKVVKTEGGTSLKLRIGSFHSADIS